MQKSHCLSCGSESQVYEEIEGGGRNQQQDAMPELSL
jgi:hypothetical protein